jgi:hypothetical protein
VYLQNAPAYVNMFYSTAVALLAFIVVHKASKGIKGVIAKYLRIKPLYL